MENRLRVCEDQKKSMVQSYNDKIKEQSVSNFKYFQTTFTYLFSCVSYEFMDLSTKVILVVYESLRYEM